MQRSIWKFSSNKRHTWARFFNISDNVGHASFVSKERSKVWFLGLIILRERLHWISIATEYSVKNKTYLNNIKGYNSSVTWLETNLFLCDGWPASLEGSQENRDVDAQTYDVTSVLTQIHMLYKIVFLKYFIQSKRLF